HLLIQDTPAIPYEFLLKAYRAVVTRYLSSLSLRPSEAFLRGVVTELEQEAMDAGLDVDDFRGARIHMLLRSPEAVYVLTLNDRDVHLCDGMEMIPLAVGGGGVEPVRIAEDEAQKELFPQRLRDVFALFRLDAGSLRDRFVVLGCGEQEKGAVLEVLSDPSWPSGGEAAQKAVKSKFVTHRILAVRFDVSQTAADSLIESLGRPFGGEGARASGRRRRIVAGAWAALIVVLVAAYWLSDRFMTRGAASDAIGDTAVLEEPEAELPPSQETGDELGVAEGVDDAVVTLSEAWKNSYEDQVTSSPVLDGNLVIFGCRDGNLYALEKETGELLWKFAGTGGIGASPALYKNMVIGADYNGSVFALDVATGRQMWTRKLPMRVVSSPVVSGNRAVVGCYDGYAYCLSGEDGKVIWKRKTKDRIRGSCGASGEIFVVPSYDGFLYGLENSTGNIRWRVNLGGNLAGGVATGPGRAVVGTPDGRVCAVGLGDGREVWSFKTDGPVKSSPVIAMGRVYIGSNDDHVYCLNLADGALMWKYETGDLVLAWPWVGGRVVYAGSY
ncbi:MAG: PQQ-binding-like beta-propeller repeat protein, partial [bacterium]